MPPSAIGESPIGQRQGGDPQQGAHQVIVERIGELHQRSHYSYEAENDRRGREDALQRPSQQCHAPHVTHHARGTHRQPLAALRQQGIKGTAGKTAQVIHEIVLHRLGCLEDVIKESEVIARVAQVHAEQRNHKLPHGKQDNRPPHRGAVTAVDPFLDMLQML